MNVESQKLELIEWILKLKDVSTIKRMLRIKYNSSARKTGTRKFGSGKHIFTYVAEDFDEPLADFKEYMR